MSGAPHPHLGNSHRDPGRGLTYPWVRGTAMPAVARIDPKTIFTPEEWRRLTARSSPHRVWLTARSSWHGMWLVVHAWGTIIASIALVTVWPNPLTWLLAVMIVGTRQLGL